MPDTPATRAIQACREAADALDAMPLRRAGIFGTPMLTAETLRDEADWIERNAPRWAEAVTPQ